MPSKVSDAAPVTAALSAIAAAAGTHQAPYHTPRKGSAAARFDLIAEQLSRPSRLARTNSDPQVGKGDHSSQYSAGDQDTIEGPEAEQDTKEPQFEPSSKHLALPALPESASAQIPSKPLPPTLSANITRLAMLMAMDDVVRTRVAGMLPEVLGTSEPYQPIQAMHRPLPSPPSASWSEVNSEEWRSPNHQDSYHARRLFTTSPPTTMREPTVAHSLQPGPPPLPSIPTFNPSAPSFNKGLLWATYEYPSSHGTPNSDSVKGRQSSSTWAKVDMPPLNVTTPELMSRGTSDQELSQTPTTHTTKTNLGIGSSVLTSSHIESSRPVPILISSDASDLDRIEPPIRHSERAAAAAEAAEKDGSQTVLGWISEAMDNLLMAGLLAGEERQKGSSEPRNSATEIVADHYQHHTTATAPTADNNSALAGSRSSSTASVSARNEEHDEYLATFATAAAFVINAALIYAVSSRLHVSEILEEAVLAIQRAWSKLAMTLEELEEVA